MMWTAKDITVVMEATAAMEAMEATDVMEDTADTEGTADTEAMVVTDRTDTEDMEGITERGEPLMEPKHLLMCPPSPNNISNRSITDHY